MHWSYFVHTGVSKTTFHRMGVSPAKARCPQKTSVTQAALIPQGGYASPTCSYIHLM